MNTTESDSAYQARMLQGVSRTFALTIPTLPPTLREVVGNAYLLCRIADTIEDDYALDSEQKNAFAEQFIAVVGAEYDAARFGADLAPRLAPQTLAAERELVANSARVLRITRSFSTAQQAILLRCVRIMSRGMAQFQRNSSPQGLPDLAALDKYCYYVAGVVGEMLCSLFCDYSPAIAEHEEELQQLAVSFGQGLQMTNILKDIWDDLERGACWLPQDVFAAHGHSLARLAEPYSPDFGAGLGDLLGVAHYHLRRALDYILLIPPREAGIRRFCLWALGMALLTLAKINQHRDFRSADEVKISRRQVRATVLIGGLAAPSNPSLRWLFSRLSQDLPAPKASIDV